MSRVLVVEDETHLAEGLRFNLEAEGHSVNVAGDGESALELLLSSGEKFDAVVLDIMLPGMDGFQVATSLREAKNYVPILMLTARGRPEDVLMGFAAGADDYLPKPFELPIFIARLQGLLRRTAWLINAAGQPVSDREANGRGAPNGGVPGGSRPNSAGESSASDQVVSFEGKTIDFSTRELRTETGTFQLTLMEARLLRHLIGNQGRIVSRKSILEDVWGLREDTDTRAIDNFIVRLRRYLEKDPSTPNHLLTVRGIGYKFVL